jgi:hypothetical protein
MDYGVNARIVSSLEVELNRRELKTVRTNRRNGYQRDEVSFNSIFQRGFRAVALRTLYVSFIRDLRVLPSNGLSDDPRQQSWFDGREKGHSMSTQEVSAEQLAELLHHYQQALQPDFSLSSERDEEWEQMPQQKRSLLVAAARLALVELTPNAREREDRRYFAKPGEAEWGC